MSVSIKYTNKLSSINKNISIFVSDLSQLKNIDFLPNINVYLNDKHFTNQLNLKNWVIFNNVLSTKNLLSNVLIVLLKTGEKNIAEIGALVSNKFDFLDDGNKKDTTFYFSNKLKTSHKNLISQIIFGFCLKSYVFNKYKTEVKNRVVLNLFNLKEFKEIKQILNLLKSINFSKDLVSEPANILNPISYAKKCLELRKIGLKVKVLNKTQLEKIGMRSLLAVSQGSNNEPRVVIFEWNLKKNKKPTILVGKGVTFDTGGISLKPSVGMEDMIFDMGGSAVVTGSMMNAALNNSSHSLVGIIGLVENMPDGNAQRPGDIVKSLSGYTIEVLNTDAEGRLVLADILTYIQNKFKPKHIIDFATLTGAVMIALGTHRAGLFSNNKILSKKLEIAGEISGEKLWRLPIGEEYDNEINTRRADMQNIGTTKYGGSIHAAQFIQRFIQDNNAWAHLDIAGVSWNIKGGKNLFSKLHSPGATAFGVRLIDQFLKGK